MFTKQEKIVSFVNFNGNICVFGVFIHLVAGGWNSQNEMTLTEIKTQNGQMIKTKKILFHSSNDYYNYSFKRNNAVYVI
jgi:hypothetical protein